MKKIFTSVFFALALLTAKAQTADITPMQLKAQATEQTRILAQKIGLNELEYIKVRNYTMEKIVDTQEANQMYANDADMLAKKLEDIETTYLKNVIATLSPRQHLNYVAYTASNHKQQNQAIQQ